MECPSAREAHRSVRNAASLSPWKAPASHSSSITAASSRPAETSARSRFSSATEDTFTLSRDAARSRRACSSHSRRLRSPSRQACSRKRSCRSPRGAIFTNWRPRRAIAARSAGVSPGRPTARSTSSTRDSWARARFSASISSPVGMSPRRPRRASDAAHTFRRVQRAPPKRSWTCSQGGRRWAATIGRTLSSVGCALRSSADGFPRAEDGESRKGEADARASFPPAVEASRTKRAKSSASRPSSIASTQAGSTAARTCVAGPAATRRGPCGRSSRRQGMPPARRMLNRPRIWAGCSIQTASVENRERGNQPGRVNRQRPFSAKAAAQSGGGVNAHSTVWCKDVSSAAFQGASSRGTWWLSGIEGQSRARRVGAPSGAIPRTSRGPT